MLKFQFVASQLLSVIGVIGFFTGNATIFLFGGIAGVINIFMLRGLPYPRKRLVIISVAISIAITVLRGIFLPSKLSPSFILFLCVYPIVIWVYRSFFSKELQ